MIVMLLAITLLTLAGFPVVVACEPSLGLRARTGVAFMFGTLIAAISMLAATCIGVAWSRTVVLVPLAVVALVAMRFALRGAASRGARVRTSPLALAADAATVTSVAGYALFATVARPWEWDFWAIWGLKAREFFIARALNFDYLVRPENNFSHPDYPPLVPLVYDFAAILGGVWDDRWMGAISVAFAVAMLLVAREELERETGSPVIGAFGTLALSGVACSPWVGLADGPLVALSVSGLLLVSRGLRENATRAIVIGSLLVGASALTKNEGVTLVVAMIAASVWVNRRKWVSVSLPAIAVLSTWMAVRIVIGIPTDLLGGSFLDRVVERLSDPGRFVVVLATGRPEGIELWIIAAIVIALAPATFRRERFLLAVAGLQLLAYLAIYAGTIHDFLSHVHGSLGRLSSHLAPIAVVVAIIGIGSLLALPVRGDLLKEEEHDQ